MKFAHKELYKQIKRGTFSDEIDRLIDHHKIDLIIDVGANNGDFAQQFILKGFKGTVLSFEPVPATYEKLNRLSAITATWHCFQLALGESEASATINVHDEDVFNSILPPSDFGKERYRTLAASREVEIQVRRLDDVLSELVCEGLIPQDFRAFLKVDTQGYDLQVIRGASKFLDQIRMLQTEASVQPIYDGAPTYVETLSLVQQLGFHPTAFNAVSRVKSDGKIIEFDLLAQR